MRCLPSSIFIFFFFNEPIWLAHHSKQVKLWRFLKSKCSIMKHRVQAPPAQVYRWKEDNICQSIWDKSEVLWRKYWEHDGKPQGNIVGIHCEPGKNEKKSFPPPTLNLKWKKARDFECMLGPSHWLHEISLPKRVCHHFWPGLIIPLAKNTLRTVISIY